MVSFANSIDHSSINRLSYGGMAACANRPTADNRPQYVEKVLDFRLNEVDGQCAAIRRGMVAAGVSSTAPPNRGTCHVLWRGSTGDNSWTVACLQLPEEVLLLWSAEDLEAAVCGAQLHHSSRCRHAR